MGVRASAPLRRKRGSEAPSPAAEPPLELAIISDPGEDLDDELAMVYLRHLVALYPSLVVRCVVCNLRPARKRAALMRQTLDALLVADSSARADGSSACRRPSRGSPAADCPSAHMTPSRQKITGRLASYRVV